jgi:hypothetical protein
VAIISNEDQLAGNEHTPDEENPEEHSGSDEANFFNPNLLKLDDDDQKRLVAIVKEDYDNGLNARNKTDWGTDKFGTGVDFDTKYADLISLYEGDDELRPERWMCGRSLKIAQAIVEMLVARLVPAVWNEDLIRWKPVEHTDKQRVKDVNDIMRWTFHSWMKVEADIVEIVRSCIMMGTVWVESFWEVKRKDLDETEQTPIVDELEQPLLDEESGNPLFVEQKILRTQEKPALRIIPINKLIVQPGCTDIQKEPIIKLEDFYFHELDALAKEGLMENVTGELKNSVDKTVRDKVSETLEQAEKIADMDAKRRAHVVETLIWYGNFDADKDGFAEEICCMVALKEDLYLRAFKTARISRKGERPIRKINFINRIHKLLGIGVLEQVKPLAEEIDAVFRQIQDANTLSILKWGFYDPNSDYSPDEHVAKPRAMYPVTNPSQNVFFPDMQIPTERLLNAIRLVLEFVERLTAASSFVMGKEGNFSGGSGTATKTAAIVTSAEMRFNLPTTNIRRGLGGVLTDIFDLCHLNYPAGLERRILGEDSQPVFESSAQVKDAFLSEMDATLLPNASFGDIGTQRELAIMLYDKFVVGGNPFIVGNPAKLWKATANVFEAFNEDATEWIGKGPTEKPSDDPIDEHTMMREGMVIHAEPQENHLEHIMVHTQALNSPDILLWPKQIVELLRTHIQEHEQLMALILQFQGGPNGGQEGAGGGQEAAGGGASPTKGQSGIQGSANPAQAAASNQTQGTTLGTPKGGQ